MASDAMARARLTVVPPEHDRRVRGQSRFVERVKQLPDELVIEGRGRQVGAAKFERLFGRHYGRLR